MVRHERLEYTNNQPKYFTSSKDARRGFCDECGTPVCWTGTWHNKEQVFVYVGTLDDISKVHPDRHAFTDSQVPWLTVNEELPGYDHSSPSDALISEQT